MLLTVYFRRRMMQVMIDSSRHYLPVSLIRAHIDAMTYNKMNVLHWHIVDSNSFPYVSTAFPNLRWGDNHCVQQCSSIRQPTARQPLHAEKHLMANNSSTT